MRPPTTASTADQPAIHLGIPLAGDRSWVAGAIYTANLCRAISLVEDELPFRATLLERGFVRSTRALSGTTRRVLHHAGSAALPQPIWRRVMKQTLSLVRSGTARSLERVLRDEGINVLFPGTTFSLPCRQIEWVPDFQHRRMPQMFPGDHWDAREGDILRTLREANLVVVSSEAALADCREFYPTYAAKLRPLPFVTLPEPAWTAPDPNEITSRLVGAGEFIILPAQFWKHKDHATAFRAFAAARPDLPAGLRLVCTGETEDFRQQDHVAGLRHLLAELRLGDAVQFTGLLPRAEQVQLLRTARLVLQPSLFEGWSALIEDATMLGKPVIASDLPVHREQAAAGVTYFPAGDATGMAAALREIWPTLPSSGWQPEEEAAALDRQFERGRDFARRLYSIARERLSRPF